MIDRVGAVVAATAFTLVVAAWMRQQLLPSRSTARASVPRVFTSGGRIGDGGAIDRLAEWLDERRPRRRPPLRPEDVARWCDDLARRVRSGSSLGAALLDSGGESGAMRTALAPIRRSLERGATVAGSVAVPTGSGTSRTTPPGHEHLALACSAIAAVADVGGSAAPALDRAASALRLRAADRDDRATQAAQARLSAHVLTVLPILMLVVLVVSDDDVREVVVGRVGATFVLIGAVLNLAGWCWMRRVIGRTR